jgi:hypothetical protein
VFLTAEVFSYATHQGMQAFAKVCSNGVDWVEVSSNFTKAGTDNIPNPNSIATLTDEQLSVSVTARWRNVNGFTIDITMDPVWPSASRGFLFSGTS